MHNKSCFNNNIITELDSNTIYNLQHNYIESILNNPEIRHIIFFGHEPLIYVKTKNDRTEIGKSNLRPLLDLIFEKNINKEITFVCADTHLYQYGKIFKDGDESKYITQIICGTGGAELDQYENTVFPYSYNKNNYPYTYTVNNCITSYGFVEINLLEDNTINHNFIPISMSMIGGRRYHIKYSYQ